MIEGNLASDYVFFSLLRRRNCGMGSPVDGTQQTSFQSLRASTSQVLADTLFFDLGGRPCRPAFGVKISPIRFN